MKTLKILRMRQKATNYPYLSGGQEAVGSVSKWKKVQIKYLSMKVTEAFFHYICYPT